jgi:N-methylhydantoinase B
LAEEAVYSVLSDRAVIPPFGILGGASAAPVRVSIRSDSEDVPLGTPGKATGHVIHQNDVFVMESAGGGGYGDPLSRELDAVVQDVHYGYVSGERARSDYGVIIDEHGALDRQESSRLRERLREQRLQLAVIPDETCPYEGIKGRHRTVRLHPHDGAALGLEAGDLVELLGNHPTPLRAWTKPAADVRRGSVPLDDFGRRAIGVKAGDKIRLRKIPTILRPGERVES